MANVRLILAIHNHQPVGNFDSVFEEAYQTSYLPFLEVLEEYPRIAVSLHTSGPLLEWLVDHKEYYIERIMSLVRGGRVEILGGAFYEPILPMIPSSDRKAQIQSYSDRLRELFGQPIRGIWIAERVWEQSLTADIADAGIEYTILDDHHFERAGLSGDELLGYYLTEDQGRLLKLFPGSERLRYLTPFSEPHATYEYLDAIAQRRPGALIVCADDGEKFGSWPQTYDHVYTHGWLRRFFDMLEANRDWIETTTFSRALQVVLPNGKIYVPDSSYREMNEWALPTIRREELERTVLDVRPSPGGERLLPNLQVGGFWRNFKIKYPESDEMYTRMLAVSRRLADLPPNTDPEHTSSARDHLHQGQCNCAFWHGSFGGLYLPHLRNAVYRHLIAADSAIDSALGITGPRVNAEIGDLNLDARQEVRVENDSLIVFIRPATGGHIYELDVRNAQTNVLATLDRRPEPYHRSIAEFLAGQSPDKPRIKKSGLDRLVVYDQHPRKSLVDHFYPLDVSLDDLQACRAIEKGDFAVGTYLTRIRRSTERITLLMERSGMADGHLIIVRKSLSMESGSANLSISYVLEDLPPNVPLGFAVEFNIAALAGRAVDRYYTNAAGARLGTLDTPLDLDLTDQLSLSDEWLDLGVTLAWSEPARLWAHPIETLNQSEGGIEAVYQSSAVVPHWRVLADASRTWSVDLVWSFTSLRHPRKPERTAPETKHTSSKAFEEVIESRS